MILESMLRGLFSPDIETCVLVGYREKLSDRQMASLLGCSRRTVTKIRRELGLPDRRGRRDRQREERRVRMCLNCQKPRCDDCLGRGSGEGAENEE